MLGIALETHYLLVFEIIQMILFLISKSFTNYIFIDVVNFSQLDDCRS